MAAAWSVSGGCWNSSGQSSDVTRFAKRAARLDWAGLAFRQLVQQHRRRLRHIEALHRAARRDPHPAPAGFERFEADAAFTDLDRRYPGHEWSQLIRDHYRPRLRAAIEVDLPPTMDPAKVDLLPKSSSKNSKESSTESNQEPRP